MRPIGFSTGALAFGDFRQALSMMVGESCDCVELSALREAELEPLVHALDTLDLRQFRYVSLHAPSQLVALSERRLAAQLQAVAEREMPIILHPDMIEDYRCWSGFGDMLCIENMDKRKAIGRTAVELERIFHELPDASLCFDVGHARQVDPTMSQAVEILLAFGGKLRQLHVSEVNARSKHAPLNMATIHAFQKIASLVPQDIPVVLESPVTAAGMSAEIAVAQLALSTTPTNVFAVG